MRPATAQVTVERLADFALCRLRVFCQERRGAYQDAARAVSALGRLLGEEGVLEGVQFAAFAQAFGGGNSLAHCGPHGRVACGGGMAVDQNEACTALAAAAAETRAFQP